MLRNDFVDWYKNEPKVCSYCDIPEEKSIEIDKHRLNIDRKDGRSGYIAGNVCLACLKCNLVKSGFLSFDEMRDVGQRYLKPKWTGITYVNAHEALVEACREAVADAENVVNPCSRLFGFEKMKAALRLAESTAPEVRE